MALLQRPIPKNFKTSQMFGVAISTQLKVAVIIMVILQTLLGFIDLLMVTHGVDYHILFFVIALNFTLFFAAELSIKVSCLFHYNIFCSASHFMGFVFFIETLPAA